VNAERYRRAERSLWDRHGIRPTERYIELNGFATRVRVLEVGAGQPLLFVHGGPNAGTAWAPLVGALRASRAFVLDRPGCGLSDPLDLRRAPLPTVAADVLAGVLDGLRLDRATVVGSSIGGTWALWFAAAHPDRVDALVLLGSPALLPGQSYPPFLRLAASPVGRLLSALPMSAAGARSTLRSIGHAKSIAAGRIDDAFIDWFVALMRDTETMANEVGLIRSALTWRGARPALVIRDELAAAVERPVLVVWGADEPTGTIDDARRLVSRFPRARLEVIADGGHLPWLDDPETVARLIDSFLEESVTTIPSALVRGQPTGARQPRQADSVTV
jgi:pimeloyl-ACP methyl ester carboxylesterase